MSEGMKLFIIILIITGIISGVVLLGVQKGTEQKYGIITVSEKYSQGYGTSAKVISDEGNSFRIVITPIWNTMKINHTYCINYDVDSGNIASQYIIYNAELCEDGEPTL